MSVALPGRRLARQSAITTVAAGIAAASGLALDVTIASTFGATATTDAFFVAARIPIGVAMIVMTGANQALVPVISSWLAKRGQAATWRSTSSLLALVAIVGAAVALLVALAAPLVVAVLAPGLDADASSLAADLLRVLVVVVPLTAAAEALRSVLNARHSFAAPAASNAVLHVVAIAVVLIGRDHGIEVVAWGYVAGAICRLAWVGVLAHRAGFRPEAASLNDPHAVRAIRLTGKPVVAAGLAPFARVVEQAFASFLPAGSITILNYGYRLVFAVAGTVFFRSIVGVLVPSITEASNRGDDRAVARLTGDGVRLIVAVAVSLTVFMATLGVPTAVTLFGVGRFDHADAVRLGVVIVILSASLVGEALQRVLLVPFFAVLDVRTPLRNAVLGVSTDLALLPVLVVPLAGRSAALYGIAVAFTLSEYVGPVHAWRALRRRVGEPVVDLGRAFRDVVPAAAITAATLIALTVAFDVATPRSRVAGLATLAVVGTLGMATFCGSLLLFNRGVLRELRVALGRDPT